MVKRQLILIRHTKSNWDNFSLTDFERPLIEDRIDDAKNMAKHLKKLNAQPDFILCSPATRTKQTAKFFCEKLEYNFEKISFDRRLYESSAEEYLKVISETDAKIKTLIVIGHNSSITDLSNVFSENRIFEVPTTGVVWLEFENADWKILPATPCKLKYFLTPKTI